MFTLYLYDTISGIRSIQISPKIFTIYTYGIHKDYERLISSQFDKLEEGETKIGENEKFYIKLGNTDFMVIYDEDHDHSFAHNAIQIEKYFTHLHLMRSDRKDFVEEDISTLKQLFLHSYLSEMQLAFFSEQYRNVVKKECTVYFTEKKPEPTIYSYITKRSSDPRSHYGFFSWAKYTKLMKLEAAQWMEQHQSYLVAARIPKRYEDTINQGELFEVLQNTKCFYKHKKI